MKTTHEVTPSFFEWLVMMVELSLPYVFSNESETQYKNVLIKHPDGVTDEVVEVHHKGEVTTITKKKGE